MSVPSLTTPRFLIPSVKVLVVFGMFAALMCLPVLWFVSEEMAADAPEFAWLQWPCLLIFAGLIVCVEIIGLALWKLLSRVADEAIFDARALTWVNAIIGAGCAAAVLFVLAWVPVSFVTYGPPALLYGFILAFAMSLGFTLLMVVMRQLLVQATSLRDEIAEVI